MVDFNLYVSGGLLPIEGDCNVSDFAGLGFLEYVYFDEGYDCFASGGVLAPTRPELSEFINFGVFIGEGHPAPPKSYDYFLPGAIMELFTRVSL